MSPAGWSCSAELLRSRCPPQICVRAENVLLLNNCDLVSDRWCGGGLRLHQLWLHNSHKEAFPYCFSQNCCCRLKAIGEQKCVSVFLLRLFDEKMCYNQTKSVEDLVSLFDELVTVIQPGEEGDESPLPCEDSSILLQVINIQTGKEEEKTKHKNSTGLTSMWSRFLVWK